MVGTNVWVVVQSQWTLNNILTPIVWLLHNTNCVDTKVFNFGKPAEIFSSYGFDEGPVLDERSLRWSFRYKGKVCLCSRQKLRLEPPLLPLCLLRFCYRTLETEWFCSVSSGSRLVPTDIYWSGNWLEHLVRSDFLVDTIRFMCHHNHDDMELH